MGRQFRREARYLFEISRSEWTEEIRGAQRSAKLAPCGSRPAMARAAG
jgi:hypothetical protein